MNQNKPGGENDSFFSTWFLVVAQYVREAAESDPSKSVRHNGNQTLFDLIRQPDFICHEKSDSLLTIFGKLL